MRRVGHRICETRRELKTDRERILGLHRDIDCGHPGTRGGADRLKRKVVGRCTYLSALKHSETTSAHGHIELEKDRRR